MRKGLGVFFSLFLLGCHHTEPLSSRQKEAAHFYTQLGLAYMNQGEYPRAKRNLLKALRLLPNSPEVNASMGYFLEKTKSYARAKYYYQRALSLAPHQGAQANNYGAFLCRSGHYTEAIKWLVAAGESLDYENSSMAYENAGLCAEHMHHYEKSMVYFSKALAQDPHRKIALHEFVKLALEHPEIGAKYQKQIERRTFNEEHPP